MAALPMASEGASSPCKNSVKGTWSFGLAPKGCDPVTDFSVLSARYNELMYQESHEGEKDRYTEAMHAFLRDAADYYLDQRRRSVTEEERIQWRRAVMALAHQESYWSHYRVTEEKELKFMRGDTGYGHGIVQIDERWHPKLTMSAKGEDLATNLMYGLDMFFQAWEKAPKKKCVAKGNFDQRARAAYSAYNGGPAQYCRWTKAKNKWARNDKGYWAKYQGQDWLKFVASVDKKSPVSVECVVEGGDRCGLGVGVETPVYMYIQASASQTAPLGEELVAALPLRSRNRMFG
jgi:hypothetical protein